MQDTAVCTNQLVNYACGFVGVGANLLLPYWRIIRRNRNGVVVSNEVISGTEIIADTDNRLEWIPNLANPNNSVLRIGPVDGTDNQSSYQCIFTLLNGNVISAVGTSTVLGEAQYSHAITHFDKEYCKTCVNISVKRWKN